MRDNQDGLNLKTGVEPAAQTSECIRGVREPNDPGNARAYPIPRLVCTPSARARRSPVSTVRARTAASHQGKGWETFTDRVIEVVNDKPERVVFVLWGASARRKKAIIDRDRHTVIESPHPSPLSAHRGFFGSQPFSRANDALVAAGREPIDWCLP